MCGQFLKYLESDLPEIARSLEVGPASLFSEAQCISTGWCAVRERTLKGEVHDENAWALGGFAGHSGLFSSGRAFGSYLRAFCQSRLGRMVVADNIRFAAQDLNSDSALGWRTARDPGSRVFGGGAGIGHMGFTGTAFWVDPHRRTYAVILTNRVVQSRTQNLKDIKTFRTKVLTLADAYLSERQLSHE